MVLQDPAELLTQHGAGWGCFRKGFLGAVIPDSSASGCLRIHLATEGAGKSVPRVEATASEAEGLGPAVLAV